MKPDEKDKIGRLPTVSSPGSGPADLSTPPEVEGYEILQVLGEGGMGVVYLAEQERPIQRQVALKIIKLGMDTKQVIARFEAESQALVIAPSTSEYLHTTRYTAARCSASSGALRRGPWRRAPERWVAPQSGATRPTSR